MSKWINPAFQQIEDSLMGGEMNQKDMIEWARQPYEVFLKDLEVFDEYKENGTVLGYEPETLYRFCNELADEYESNHE